jgi:hypothetical protein
LQPRVTVAPANLVVAFGYLREPAMGTAEWLDERLLGRVVGVSTAPLGNLLGPGAGYLDEDAKNAEFDECEYLTVLMAVGYEVVAVRHRDGGLTWMQKSPEQPLTAAQQGILFAQVKSGMQPRRRIVGLQRNACNVISLDSPQGRRFAPAGHLNDNAAG